MNAPAAARLAAAIDELQVARRPGIEIAELVLRRSTHMAALDDGPAYQATLVAEADAAVRFAGVWNTYRAAELRGLLQGALMLGAAAASS